MNDESTKKAKSILREIESQVEHAQYMLDKPKTIDLSPKEVVQNAINTTLNLLTKLKQIA